MRGYILGIAKRKIKKGEILHYPGDIQFSGICKIKVKAGKVPKPKKITAEMLAKVKQICSEPENESDD